MDQGNGTPATYIECFEFFLAPYPVAGTPAQGDPLLAPDVSVNSWGCPPEEGCSPGSLLAAVQADRAAGILTEMSAGNSGSSGCSTVTDPAAIYDESFTTGALTTSTDNIASFSSLGPVTVDGSNRVKPDIAAPGTGTRSSTRTSDTSFGSMTGTSMAGPHVAGGIALLLSAAPGLNGNVDGLEQCLAASAVPLSSAACGSSAGVYPNNTFGYGRLDVLAAVQLLLSNVSIGVAGSTNIGAPSSCVGGLATATDGAGGTNTHAWGYRTTPGGTITFIPGQTNTTYMLHCGNFPASGTFYLVERTTPQCGVPVVSNEITVTVNSTPVELQTFRIE
jgi:subtilisin family serine protease